MQRRTAPAMAFVVLAGLAAPGSAQNVSLERAATPYDSLLEEANDAHRRGALETAAALLERAVALAPERLEAYNNMGVAQLDAGDYEQAVIWFTRLARIVGERPAGDAEAALFHARAHDGLLEAGGMLLDEGDALVATDVFVSLLELYPESGDGRHNLALAYLELGLWSDMMTVGREMLVNEPLSDAAWAFVQDGYLGIADEAESDQSYTEIMQRHDDVRAQVESLPFRLDALELGADGTMRGNVIGAAAAAGENVRLRFRFIGRDGTLDERTITLTAPGPGAQAPFAAPAPVTNVTGWAYTIVD